MPHINLLYPFLADINEGVVFQEAANRLQTSLSSIKPFTVIFSKDSFSFFKHSKSCTVWLKPLWSLPGNRTNSAAIGSTPRTEDCHPDIIALQRHLVELYPKCSDLNEISAAGFTPHLSLGQCSAKDVDKLIAELRTDWKEIRFEVTEIQLISRTNFEDPFHIRHRIQFQP
jgi:poly(A) polymerase